MLREGDATSDHIYPKVFSINAEVLNSIEPPMVERQALKIQFQFTSSSVGTYFHELHSCNYDLMITLFRRLLSYLHAYVFFYRRKTFPQRAM